MWDQFNHGNPDAARLQLAMEPNLTTLKVNDPLHFSVRSGEDGYLVILELGVDGTIAPIFPEELTLDAAHVKSGQVVRLPVEEGYHYKPDREGTEMLRAVLYSSRDAAAQMIAAFTAKRSVVFKAFISQSREKALIKEADKPFVFYTSELTFEVVPESEVKP